MNKFKEQFSELCKKEEDKFVWLFEKRLRNMQQDDFKTLGKSLLSMKLAKFVENLNEDKKEQI